MKTETQRALHLNGRHLNTSLFITTQYCMTAPAVIRGNIDYIIALKEPNKNIRKKLYEYYFGIFPTYTMFESIFNRSLASGKHFIKYNGSNLPSGMYFYKIVVNGDNGHSLFSSTKKMVLMK